MTDTISLIDLQTERARLAALEAQREYREARDATRTADRLLAAALAVREAVLRELDALPERLGESIGAEPEETRVHYLLSDTLHQVLDTLGRRAERVSAAHLPEFGVRFRRGARPRDLLTVAQWADKYRWLSSGTNSPGQWKTVLTPYLREIMDDLSEHSPVRKVVFIKSSGVGGTEAMFNWIGYVMHHLGNRDMLAVVSTLELRDRSFNPRLSKMLRETPVLNELLDKANASRSASNRADKLEYGPMAKLIKAGANSPDSLSSDHIPYAVLDEVDRYPWDVGGEGDPMTLIDNRQRTFTRAKTFLLSTPTNEQFSRIDQEYQASDQRRYHVPCPHCGEYHVLDRARLKWRTAIEAENAPAGQRKTPIVDYAWFVCPACGAEIQEGHKPQMLANGRWIATHPQQSRIVHGYHLNAAYSPIGLGYSWKQIAQRWLGAQEDSTKLKAVINTDWGEVYREEKDALDDVLIAARCEDYTRAELERDGKVWRITAWADVQKDRLEMTVVAWGADEEAWVLDHVILPGATAEPFVWDELGVELDSYGVDFAGVDSGYQTDMVHRFCTNRHWCVPTKGIAGPGRPIVQDRIARRQRLRRARRLNYEGRPMEPIGVDTAKVMLFDRLRLASPGPRYIHFPRSAAIDDEYFRQLASEELQKKRVRGRIQLEWVQTRTRNEALDCLVGNLAICLLCGPLLNVPGKRRRIALSAIAAGEDGDLVERQAPSRARQEPAAEIESLPPKPRMSVSEMIAAAKRKIQDGRR